MRIRAKSDRGLDRAQLSSSPLSPLACARVHKHLGSSHVLRGIDLEFSANQSVAIMGPSGSGKTTLLQCLSGLDRASTGQVNLLGRDLNGLTPDQLSELRLREVGFVFQQADLVPELTLSENLALPLELARIRRSQIKDQVFGLLALLGIEEAAGRRPHEVSGGQAQRAAVARAVVASPAVVFADEPTGALDSHNRLLVLDLLLTATRQVGALLVTVTHDPEVARQFDRKIQLLDGLVVSDELRGPA